MGNPTPKKWATMREKFDRMRGPEAAAFAASALMLAQDSPPDMACYYTADTQCFGMFDLFGGPGRVYYAFVAFNQLTKTPNRVACKRQGDAQPGSLPLGITACAGLAEDRKAASILVSNFSPTFIQVSVSLRNVPMPSPVLEILAVDAANELASIGKSALKAKDSTITLDLPANAVYLLRIAGSPVK